MKLLLVGGQAHCSQKKSGFVTAEYRISAICLVGTDGGTSWGGGRVGLVGMRWEEDFDEGGRRREKRPTRSPGEKAPAY